MIFVLLRSEGSMARVNRGAPGSGKVWQDVSFSFQKIILLDIRILIDYMFFFLLFDYAFHTFQFLLFDFLLHLAHSFLFLCVCVCVL